MDDWLEGLARALGEEALTGEEAERLLGVARDVAHRVERRVTPLAAFLVGTAVGRASAGGSARGEALSTALEALEGLLPEPTAEA